MPYDPRDFFDAGFADFLKHEPDLIVSGVSERSLCARLMLHLEAVKERFGFGRYVVDVDYNRMGRRSVKYMLKQGGLVQIESDLLVHRRGEPDNLIALEMKKWETVPADKERDRIRLQILTAVAGPGPRRRGCHGRPVAPAARGRVRIGAVPGCEPGQALLRRGGVPRRRAGRSGTAPVLRRPSCASTLAPEDFSASTMKVNHWLPEPMMMETRALQRDLHSCRRIAALRDRQALSLSEYESSGAH